MSEITEPIAQPVPGASPAAGTSVPSVPDDYEELKAFKAQYEPVIGAIAPIWETDIYPLVTDENEREYTRRARKTYHDLLKEQEPQIPAELQPVVEQFEKRLTPIVDYIDSERKAREDEKNATIKASQDANLAFAQRLAAERPDLVEENYAGMHMVAALAQRDNISLEDSWKTYGSRFQAPAKGKTPPESLRGGAAAPGVPGPSTEPKAKNRTELARRLAGNIRAGASGMRG